MSRLSNNERSLNSFRYFNKEAVLKGDLFPNPPPELGYGTPDWIGSTKPRRGSGGHNVGDSLQHRSATSVGTRIMCNRFTGVLVRRLYVTARVEGLSVNDIRDISKRHNLHHSSKTIYKVLKDCVASKIRRVSKGLGRSTLKVKLGKIAHITSKWIRHIIYTGYSDLNQIVGYIEQDLEPP